MTNETKCEETKEMLKWEWERQNEKRWDMRWCVKKWKKLREKEEMRKDELKIEEKTGRNEIRD